MLLSATLLTSLTFLNSNENTKQVFAQTNTSQSLIGIPYPDQPSINPKLEATQKFWSPPTIHKVTDNAWSAVQQLILEKVQNHFLNFFIF